MKFTMAIRRKPRWHTLIKQKRARMGLTRREFGELFGVTAAAVYQWEMDMTSPPAELTWWLYEEAVKKERQKER